MRGMLKDNYPMYERVIEYISLGGSRRGRTTGDASMPQGVASRVVELDRCKWDDSNDTG